jgi:hypothetical protein
MATHLLFESASGYGVFECTSTDIIGADISAVKESVMCVPSRYCRKQPLPYHRLHPSTHRPCPNILPHVWCRWLALPCWGICVYLHDVSSTR